MKIDLLSLASFQNEFVYVFCVCLCFLKKLKTVRKSTLTKKNFEV